ncbi:MAG: type II toxin-antitoxin system VapC family toxin [Pseudomonadota bacterium]
MKFFVNQIIVSETIGNFSSENEQQRFLSDFRIAKSNLPFSAAYPAGKAHLAYRNAGGSKLRILPEFLIGAHALVEDLTLMTRDPKVYRAYFPDLNIISPETHPL